MTNADFTETKSKAPKQLAKECPINTEPSEILMNMLAGYRYETIS